MKKAVSKNIPILEKCNLRQAIEYLAFGYEPVGYIYEMELKHDTSDKIRLGEARATIKNLLINKSIEALGVKGQIDICDATGADGYIRIYPDEQEYIWCIYDDFIDCDKEYIVKEFYITNLQNTTTNKWNHVEKLPVDLDFLDKSIEIDWDRSLITENLVGYSCSSGGVIFEAKGYGLVEIDFESLEKWRFMSDFKKTKEDKDKEIKEFAEKIPANITKLGKARTELRKIFPKFEKKGYSPNTITRVLEEMETKDGKKRFIKDIKKVKKSSEKGMLVQDTTSQKPFSYKPVPKN